MNIRLIIVVSQHRQRTCAANTAAVQDQKAATGPMRLYVGSLHFNITEDMLRSIFEPFGKIDHIQLIMDSETGRSKGYGFIAVGCDAKEKEIFWKNMGEVMLEIPGTEKVWIGADLNGHVGGVDGYGSNIGKFGFGTRNEEGDKILEFVAANNLAITNTYFQKSDSRRITYTSGGVNSQVDYIVCRRSELKRVQDCKVLPGEAVAKQHKVVTCTATVKAEKTKKRERTRKTRW
ncbi:craniofacial development protein 2-like [Penaeus chinensis]|uniref:craniofacial development protein 2-like n=1 Tax=Penaeus chinensis TaxID=139456 RepID=UPI001FB705D5|nr:craniofacial development protein 2-like [Penaeus chinensis]